MGISRTLATLACLSLLVTALAACEDQDDVRLDEPGEARGPTAGGRTFTAAVRTGVVLLPLARKAADVVDRPPGIEVDVRASGGENALASLCAGQAEVALAERTLSAPERRACRRNGIDPVRSLVAHQVVAMHRHAGLGIRCLTAGQLRRRWRLGWDVERYSRLGPGLPDRPVRLIAYPPRSAAFELFARRITGSDRAIRADARRAQDRLSFERLLAETPGALAFAPYDLPDSDRPQPPVVAVAAGGGRCVRPSAETVRSGAYRPLSAPLYMYTPRRALGERAVKDFVDYVLDDSAEVASYPGLVPPRPAPVPEAEPRA